MPEPKPGPTTAEILSLLQEVLLDAGVDLPPDDLKPETSLTMDLGIDSFHLVEIATRVEVAFESRFTLVDWVVDQQDAPDPAFTLASLIVFIQANLSEARLSEARLSEARLADVRQDEARA
jgi:acyl carrier protein